MRSKFPKKKQSLIVGKAKVKLVKARTLSPPNSLKLERFPSTYNEDVNGVDNEEKIEPKETQLLQKQDLAQKTDNLVDANGAQLMGMMLNNKLNNLESLVDNATASNDG